MISPHSVPTSSATIDRWIKAGWAVVCPDFDRPDRTIMRWAGLGEARRPAGEDENGASYL